MADSSARNLNYQQSQQQTEQPKKAIVLNPKSVPWTAFEKSLGDEEVDEEQETEPEE